jgi:hypothetical protein
VAVSIESIKAEAASVGTELPILQASLASPLPCDEHWWWLREVSRSIRRLGLLGR